MRGYAHCIFLTNPRTTRRFENVKLTYIGGEAHAILSRDNGEDEPEELLVIEAAQLDILSDYTFDLEGFVCTDQDGQTYHKCILYFAHGVSNRES